MQIAKHILLCLLCLLTCISHGQGLDMAREEKLADRILLFVEEFNQLSDDANFQIRISDANLESGSYIRLINTQIFSLNTQLQSLEYRWTAFTQAEQSDIANSEALMDLMSRVQQLDQATRDAIALQQDKCNAIADFSEAERLLNSQDTVYKALYKKAMGMSMAKQMAPQLEKVKAEELTIFEKIQTSYNKSKAAVELIPQLQSRSAALDEQYYSIKAISGKIQAMEYVPPIQRIKDYLLGLACIAMILVFINMAHTKIKAAKSAREMLKKQKELLKKSTDGTDYPTI